MNLKFFYFEIEGFFFENLVLGFKFSFGKSIKTVAYS